MNWIMEKLQEQNLTELNTETLEEINGGFVHFAWGAYYATKYLIAAYGATKVATGAGAATGVAAYVYVNS
jgi:hypothetical protein